MPRRSPSIPLPDHVNAVTSRGKRYYYYQPGRGTDHAAKPVRIPGEPDQPEWWETYRRLAGVPPPKRNANSFAALIEVWQVSPQWQAMGAKTQGEWARYCNRIRDAWGDLEVSGLPPSSVAKLRDAWRGHSANNMLRCLSSMMRWAVEQGYRDDNPCREVRQLPSGDGYEPWPWDIIDTARRTLRPDLWHTVALALYTGRRQADVLAMRWDAIDGNVISVRQSKTGKALVIPLHIDLRGVLGSIPRNAVTILTSTTGKPWTESGFRATWRKRRPAITIDRGLVFHGLRKTAVVTLLEAGCTDAEVAAITGQSRDMVEHYGKQVNQARLARSAMARWEGSDRP